MRKATPQEENPEPSYGKIGKEEDDKIETRLELLKYATKVLSRNIKNDITPDFVMAKFNHEKDKEGIIEMTNNAYFCKRMLLEMKKATKWHYNQEQQKWILRTLYDEEKDKIEATTNKMFDTFMVRNSTTAVLNRNVKDNYLLRLISGLDTEETTPETETRIENKTTNRLTRLMETIGLKKKEETTPSE